MKENQEKRRWYRHPLLKAAGSLVALAFIFYFGISTVRFCMGLFLTGDYFVTFPGGNSPILYQAMPDQKDELQETIGETVPESEAFALTNRATITVAGDIMMHMPTVRSGKTDDGYNYDYIFSYINQYVSKAGFSVANLETTLSGTDNGNQYTGFPKFNSPDAIAAAAKTAGFDMLLTANNHSNDYGTFGMKRTLDILKRQELLSLGTTSIAETPKYLIQDVDGIQVGMICYTYGDINDEGMPSKVNGLKLDDNAVDLINVFDYQKLDLFYTQMETHIADMKEQGAEAIVLFIHWGDELSAKVSNHQKTIAQKMCDLGVDVIAGSHPHVLQPMELLESTTASKHTTVCMYSLGNFLSNQRASNISLTTGQSEDGALFTFSFVKYTDGSVYLESAELLPTWVLIRGTGDSRKYYILPLDENVGSWEAVFELDENQLKDAKNSLKRTTESLSEGQTAVKEFLDKGAAERSAAVEAAK